ncbi:hypothetical protein EES43_27885 [Streptomyces sp. ADI96-02]|nr:hypothetical protein EES43_27885 [Streptomyces sp. ADI96-02]
MALAGIGLAAATIASGGTMTVPVAIAIGAAAATVGSAADQIAAHANNGQGFMPDDVRTGFDVVALAGGIAGGVVGAAKAPAAAKKIQGSAQSLYGKAQGAYKNWKNSGSAQLVKPSTPAAPSRGGLFSTSPRPPAEVPSNNLFFTKEVGYDVPWHNSQVDQYRSANGIPEAFGADGPTVYLGTAPRQGSRSPVMVTEQFARQPDGSWAKGPVNYADPMANLPVEKVPQTVLVRHPNGNYYATESWKSPETAIMNKDLNRIMFTVQRT